MNKLLSSCLFAAMASLAVTGCKRAEQTPPAPVVENASILPAVAFQKIDTVPGTGAEATAGVTAVVNYTGWLFDPKAENQRGVMFDSSSGRSPFSFKLGGGQVIKGWDDGVQGMKVGGKRTLILPPEFGYGASGAGPIPPNANLIFEVELLEVR